MLEVAEPYARERLQDKARRRKHLDVIRPNRNVVTQADHAKFNRLVKAGIPAGEAREEIKEDIYRRTGIRRSAESLRRHLKRSRTPKK